MSIEPLDTATPEPSFDDVTCDHCEEDLSAARAKENCTYVKQEHDELVCTIVCPECGEEFSHYEEV